MLVLLLGLACPPAIGQIHILSLGNSITQGETGHISYREPLWNLLQVAGYNVDFVGSMTDLFQCGTTTGFDPDHEGHWGWRVNEILDGDGNLNNCASQTGANVGLSDWLLGYTPDIALIHLGTNDLLHDNQPPADLILEVEQVIATLRADNPQVAIFVATLIPSNSATLNARIANYNPLLPGMVATLNTPNSPVILVDQAAGYNPAVDNYDSYHPGPTGRQKMAQKWFDAIDNHLSPVAFPVAWGEIGLTVDRDRVRLDWQTLRERASRGFRVEHWTTEAPQPRALGFVPSQGDSHTLQEYYFLAGPFPAGKHFFRLRQLDVDGSETVSEVLTADILTTMPTLAAYPQPAGEVLELAWSDARASGRWLITDLAGRAFAQGEISQGNHTLSVPTAQWPSGLYVVRLAFADGNIVQKKVLVGP